MSNTLEKSYFLDLNEITLFNYDKCLSGKLIYTRKNTAKGSEDNDFLAWSTIYDQYLSKYGVGKDYSLFLDKIEELTLLNCDLAITGDTFLLNKIRLIEAEIKEYSEKESMELVDQLVLVGKWNRGRVNPKETTAGEFYAMIEMIKRESSNKKVKSDGKED